MKLKTLLLVVLTVLVSLSASLPASAWNRGKPFPEYVNGIWGWDELGSKWMPVYTDASGSLVVTGTMTATVSISTITAELAPGSNTIGLFWDAPLATPTITDAISVSTPSVFTAAADRSYVVIQNKHATESCYVVPGITATPGYGIEVFGGSSITRAWDSDVTFSVVSTNSVPICIDEEVRP